MKEARLTRHIEHFMGHGEPFTLENFNGKIKNFLTTGTGRGLDFLREMEKDGYSPANAAEVFVRREEHYLKKPFSRHDREKQTREYRDPLQTAYNKWKGIGIPKTPTKKQDKEEVHTSKYREKQRQQKSPANAVPEPMVPQPVTQRPVSQQSVPETEDVS